MCISDRQYGHALFAKRSVSALMDAAPLTVDFSITVEELETLLAVDKADSLLTGFIVTVEGRYYGVGTALSLLRHGVARAEARREELEKARHSAEIANAAKSALLANTSHELRTPLNAIIGFSDIMRQAVFGPIQPDRYAGYVEDIHGSAQHLLGLINDLLDMAKIEAGERTLTLVPCNLGEVVDRALTLCHPRALTASVTLSTDIATDTPLLKADARALLQMLLNLITNAIKFSHRGGRADVSAGVRDDGGLTVSVADQGIGLSPTEAARVREPFVQADDGLARHEEGTGLGLSIVARLMELHGGDLRLESEKGVGTTVSLDFPRALTLQPPTA